MMEKSETNLRLQAQQTCNIFLLVEVLTKGTKFKMQKREKPVVKKDKLSSDSAQNR